jgi:hypothetical protein
VTIAYFVACDKGTPATHETSPPAIASAPAIQPQPSARPSDAAAPTTTFRGTYKSEAATLYIPTEPDWRGVRWTVKDSPLGIGDGPMALTIDAATGRVRGAVDGPLGPASIDGFARQGTLTATVARKDPSDHGFAGTLTAAVENGHADGTMSVSLAEASAIRHASFTLEEPGKTPH